jgi:hypothetical protein
MVVGPGGEIAAGEEGRSRLRASHGDREHVIDTLKAAYVYGLVTKDEFDARVGQTFASRTYAELALATADIPAWLAAAQLPREPARESRNAPAVSSVRSGDRAVIATATFTGLALVAALFFAMPASGVLLLGAVASTAVSAAVLIRAHILGSRNGKRSGGQRPPRGAIDCGPRAAGRAASAERLPHSHKPQRLTRTDAARSLLPRPQLSR